MPGVAGWFGKKTASAMANRVEIETALRRLTPKMPGHQSVVVDHALDSRGLRPATPETAAWLSLVAYVRHALTEYDVSWRKATTRTARDFRAEEMERVLAEWDVKRKWRRGSTTGSSGAGVLLTCSIP